MAEPTQDPKPTKKKAVKKTAVQKPAEDLVLKKSLYLNGIARFEDGKQHMTAGTLHKAGTIVTEDMVATYDAIREKLGGTTPITKFCH